jgi:hypothetical protein
MNNRVPMTTTVVLLFIALASVGIGYGLWSKTLYIDGTVNTGSVDSVFVDPFTDDDNEMNDSGLDVGDTGECLLYGDGSCDPAASGHNVPRKDKDVGECIARLDPEDQTNETLLIEITNAYPSYYCTVFFDIHNTGTVPVKVQSLGLKGPDITAGYITAEWTDIFVGQQIDPCSQNMIPGDIDIHVEQSAPQGETLELKGTIQLVQWNEYVELGWEECLSGMGPCTENPEVEFEGNTVIMGELGEADLSQATSVHGGAALLPPGSSYDVTFQYHICTWDAYNALTTSGTGYWDSFSVSTSNKPYWEMPYSDPVSAPFIWGGANYADGILECENRTETKSMPGDPLGDNYLNVLVDTGSLPQANHAHPSYGTITVEKIVVNP